MLRGRELFWGLWPTVPFGARSSPRNIPAPHSGCPPHGCPQFGRLAFWRLPTLSLQVKVCIAQGSHLPMTCPCLHTPRSRLPVFAFAALCRESPDLSPDRPSRPICLGCLSAWPPFHPLLSQTLAAQAGGCARLAHTEVPFPATGCWQWLGVLLWVPSKQTQRQDVSASSFLEEMTPEIPGGG